MALALVVSKSWPVPQTVEGSVVEALVLDRVIVGLLRMTIVVATLYAIASVPALIVGGRWAKGMGTGGIVADDPRTAVPAKAARLRREITELELQNERLSRERDALVALLDDETRPR